VVIETWRRHYNEVRPHSSLGYLTPAEFAARLGSQGAAPAQAMGRRAAAHGASAPHPIASSPREGQAKAATGVVVSS
jgi:putative transposase